MKINSFYFLGTGKPYILRQTSITIKENKKCGAKSDNMLCAGEVSPKVHDSCQVSWFYEHLNVKKLFKFVSNF